MFDERPDSPPLFVLFGIPVTVSIWHFVWMLFIFAGLFSSSPALGAGAILIGFVSTLMHEFGHALVSLAFGLRPSVALIGMGGLCYHLPPQKPWHNLLIVAAGPAMNFLLAGGFLLLAGMGDERLALGGDDLLGQWLTIGMWINVVWGIYNLLPIWPLDGGNLLRTLLHYLVKNERRADRATFAIGTAAAGLAAVWMLSRGSTFAFFFLAMAAVQNFQLFAANRDLRATKPRDNPQIPKLIVAARDAYQRGDFPTCIRLCHQARSESGGSREQQTQIWQILALASAQTGALDDAVRFAERVPGSAEMAQVQAWALERLADPERIRRFLTSPESSLLPPERLDALQAQL